MRHEAGQPWDYALLCVALCVWGGGAGAGGRGVVHDCNPVGTDMGQDMDTREDGE